MLDRLADVIRTRDGFKGSNEADPALALSREGAAGFGGEYLSTGGSLTASRRNGGPLSWWRDSSLTSRGDVYTYFFLLVIIIYR